MMMMEEEWREEENDDGKTEVFNILNNGIFSSENSEYLKELYLCEREIIQNKHVWSP